MALLPQVVLLMKSGGQVSKPVLYFVACSAVAKCGDMIPLLFFQPLAQNMTNWEAVVHWVNGELFEKGADMVSFYLMVVLAQVVQVLLLADYLYYFVRSRPWGGKPTEDVNPLDV